MLTLLGAYLAVTTLLEGLGMARLTLPGYIAAGAGLGSDEVARAGGPFVSGEANGMSATGGIVNGWRRGIRLCCEAENRAAGIGRLATCDRRRSAG